MSFLMDSQNVEREDPVFLKLFQKCCKVFQFNQSMYLSAPRQKYSNTRNTDKKNVLKKKISLHSS